MDRLRVVDSLQVIGKRFGGEPLPPRAEIIIFRVGIDHPFRQVVGLCQEEPVPVAKRKFHIGPAESLPGRDDDQDGQPAHPAGMVEGQAVGTASTPVVTHH